MTIPYLAVLAQGDPIFGQAVLLGVLMGGVMAPAIAALGMLMSLWSNTIKTSMFLSLGIYILIMMPQSLPGKIQSGMMGRLLETVSPLMATFQFMAKILVNHRSITELWPWLVSPIAFCAFMLVVLLGFASPGLRLEAGQGSRIRKLWARFVGAFVIFGFATGVAGSPASAQDTASRAPSSTVTASHPSLEIGIDLNHRVASQGDSIVYTTPVTNRGMDQAPPLTVAMNIINLDANGDVVDPEDWSPQRTQYIYDLGSGQTITLRWNVNASMDGDYMVYMVVIPKPESPESTTQPVASSGIHLTVRPFTKLNPRGDSLVRRGYTTHTGNRDDLSLTTPPPIDRPWRAVSTRDVAFKVDRLEGVPMRYPHVLTAAMTLLLATSVLAADKSPSSTAGNSGADKSLLELDPSNFGQSENIDHAWWPLKPGTQWVYGGFVEADGKKTPHRIVFTVTDLTKVIGGVRCRVILDSDFSDGTLIEKELTFFAQDKLGNVWHLGQYRETYEDEFVGGRIWNVGNPEGAKAGIMMPADPKLGTPSYSEGFAPAPFNWTDRGRVYQMGQKTKTPTGSYDDVMVIEEFDNEKAGDFQLKYYARGVGNVRVGWRGVGKERETMELTRIVNLKPAELSEARTTALDLEKRASMYCNLKPVEHAPIPE